MKDGRRGGGVLGKAPPTRARQLLTLSLPLAKDVVEEEEEGVTEDPKSEQGEASGPSVELGEGGARAGRRGTLTSSGQSEGVAAESGPSVVVAELSLAGERAWWLVSHAPPPALMRLESPLSMSCSSSPPSPSSVPSSSSSPPCPEDALRSTDSPGCRERCDGRGCSVMMSWPADASSAEDSLAPSLVTEAAGGITGRVPVQHYTSTNTGDFLNTTHHDSL